MPDLSKLSDSDLEALHRGDLTKVSDEGLGVLSQPGPGEDTRTTGERVSDVFFGNHPKPEAPDNRPQSEKDTELAAYKENLPAAALGAASVFTPLPEAAVGASAAEKGLAALGRMGVSTGTGAAVGALTPGDRVENAKRGAVLGALPGAAAEGVGALGGWAEDAAQAYAHEKALKSAGAMKADFKQINNKGVLDDLGGYLLDNSHVAAGSTTRSVAESLESAKENAGKAIGNIIDSVDSGSKPAISARDIALNLSQDPDIQKLSTVPGSEAVASKVEGYLNTLYKNGDAMSLKEAQELRQAIDHNINWDKTLRDMPQGQAMLGKIRNALSDKMKESVDAFDAAHGSISSGRLSQANDAYSKLSELSKISANKIASEAANRGLSLTDYISGAAGSATGAKVGSYLTGEGDSHKAGAGALVGGLIGALGNKAARTYGPALLASGANSLIAPAARIASQVPAVSPGVAALLAGTKKREEPQTAVERRLSGKRSE